MKYLVYLNNYNIRQAKAQYLWLLYEILSHNLDAFYILTEEYLEKRTVKDSWEVRQAVQKYGSFEKLISRLRIEDCLVMDTPDKWISNSEITIPSQILYNTVYGYHEEEVHAIVTAIRKRNIRAGVTWVNNKTFKETMEKFNLPVIHHELGPLRPSTYIPTVYLDFSGVNGDTEFDKRFEEFLKIADKVPILSRKELLRIVAPEHYIELYRILENKGREYEIGVGLQVEVDTNLLLFNKGCSWIDPVLAAKADSSGKVFVRPHPLAGYIMKPDVRLVIDDLKGNALGFINRCNKIYCLNSSVGFEALLLGREAKVFGDSPFRNMCSMDEDTQLKALNFAIFGYLIHRDLLFNDSYYDFRLKNRGDEKAIYIDNMKRLLSMQLSKIKF